MNKAGKIISVSPPHAIAGGEITIECDGFKVDADGRHGVFINARPCRIVAASTERIIAIVPPFTDGEANLHIESGRDESEPYMLTLGKKIADEMHIVANPAVDPRDNSLVLTRSGSRGQQLPATLFRLETDGYVHEMNVEILNPTGIAFDGENEMFISNRSDGEVVRISRDEEIVSVIGGLGVATGIAFDAEGMMYVGDRSGTIYRIPTVGMAETFAVLEPSVSAFHMAFGPDGRLFVTAPGLSSFDAVYAIDADGAVEKYFRGFGRPQGLAFDTDGNLYIAACYRGRHGIVKIDAGGQSAETIVAGNNLVGLCFTRNGEMIVAASDTVHSLNMGIYGKLLR
jgi:DNA-binding beta-propeller fold protein YncE